MQIVRRINRAGAASPATGRGASESIGGSVNLSGRKASAPRLAGAKLPLSAIASHEAVSKPLRGRVEEEPRHLYRRMRWKRELARLASGGRIAREKYTAHAGDARRFRCSIMAIGRAFGRTYTPMIGAASMRRITPMISDERLAEARREWRIRSSEYRAITWGEDYGPDLLDTIDALKAENAKLRSDNERLAAFREAVGRRPEAQDERRIR